MLTENPSQRSASLAFVNTFDSGLNSDIVYQDQSSKTYRDAQGIAIGKDGKYFGPTNLKGTEYLDTILSQADIASDEALNVMGSVVSMYVNETLPDNPIHESITAFVSRPGALNGIFEIYVYDIIANITYKIFEVTDLPLDSPILEGSVDAIAFGEDGIDNIYYTDNQNFIRKIECRITGTPYSVRGIELRRYFPFGDIVLSDIIENEGSITVGTYFFAFRLLNDELKRYTTFSILKKVVVSTKEVVTAPLGEKYGRGGIGDIARKKVELTFTLNQEEIDNYDFYQLAVIKNIDGLNTPSLEAFTIPEGEIPGGLNPGDPITVEYDNNTFLTSIDINELVTEDAAIKTVKTIDAKNNRLFGANVTYNVFPLDNGTPELTNAEIIKEPVGKGYSDNTEPYGYNNDLVSSQRQGYFRNEVYRYYIHYHNEFGNFAPGVLLDFSSVAENQAAAGVKDFKYPTRDNIEYTLFNEDNEIEALGLRILGIVNHPSWAKGFVITRAKRLENVIFQTPVVPTITVENAAVIGDYPTNGDPNPDTEAQVANPLGTYVPKNHFHGIAKSIIRDQFQDFYNREEVKYRRYFEENANPPLYQAIVFPPAQMYSNGTVPFESYTHQRSDRLVTIDAAALKLEYEEFHSTQNGNPNNFDPGEFANTSVSGIFHAYQRSAYYYERNNAKPSIETAIAGGPAELKISSRINEFGLLNNGDDRYTFVSPMPGARTVSFGDYASLDSTLSEGVTPNNYRMGLVATSEEELIGDISYKAVTNNGGVVSLFVSVTDDLNFIDGQIDGLQEPIQEEQSSEFITADDEVVSVVRIANVERGLSDGRYGDDFATHEPISTGTYYALTDDEVANNTPIDVDVWGGDCNISLHVFKISDSTYSISTVESLLPVNIPDEAKDRWGTYFQDTGPNSNFNVERSIPLKNAGQTIAVYLESKINADIANRERYQINQGNEIQFVAEGDIRIPFDYIYNHSFSLENANKIFQLRPRIFKNIERYKAREVYSDQKVYQTDIEGFDRFRANSIYDLDETHGGVTKNIVAGDRLYAVMESAVAHLPVDSRVIETADSDTLAVRSGEVIGIPQYFNTVNGSQHIRTVKGGSSAFYFADNRNKKVIKVEGLSSQIVSDLGRISYFNEKFNENIPERRLSAVLDTNRDEYNLFSIKHTGHEVFSQVYSNKLGFWDRSIGVDDNSILQSGVFTSEGLMFIGMNTNEDLNIEKMYSGVHNSLFGNLIQPYIEFVFNPDIMVSKTVDDLVLDASDSLDTADITIFKQLGAPDDALTGLNIDVVPREDLFRVKALRVPGTSRRLRGKFAIMRINWKPDQDEEVTLHSVLTKYRQSTRLVYR